LSELQAGERIGGRYVLEQRLGLGGMGEVWLAEFHGAGAFRRRVVIKCLAPERRGDQRLAAMLADEARVVGLLHHPGVVAAIDYIESEEHGPIFVLEFVDGASLRTVLKLSRRKNALLPEALAAHIGAQVAHALHAAHTAVGLDGEPLGLVHRDVAPDNVLLSRGGAVYLGDFGVARASGNFDVTEPGTAPKGKLGFMAPEQAMGRKVGPPADIFSLGRVVAQAADVSCGPALRAVIEKATAEDPRDRYKTASELAAAFVQACPPPPDPDNALARWLQEAAPEALVSRQTSPGGAPPRSDPPPAGRPMGVGAPRAGAQQAPLFAAVPPPSRWKLKAVALGGIVVFIALPVALTYSAMHGRYPIQRAVAGIHAPRGELRVTSRPVAAEVYVDGTLRGNTPLMVELPPGKHAVRVGSPRLEHWRAAEVHVKDNVEHRLDVDLSE
jgi:tRNA A-37 threonylcarbamoyl transferase component Bud32